MLCSQTVSFPTGSVFSLETMMVNSSSSLLWLYAALLLHLWYSIWKSLGSSVGSTRPSPSSSRFEKYSIRISFSIFSMSPWSFANKWPVVDELVREGTFFIGGGGRGPFGCIVFSKVLTLPSRPAKEKHDPSQQIAWKCVTLPVSSYPSWYYWSLLTGCLRIVTHCHNTVAKRCQKTILKCCAGDPSNKYYIRIFCQGAHLCQFQFWKKMLWRWPDVLKRCG